MSRDQRHINENSDDDESLFDFLNDEKSKVPPEPDDKAAQAGPRKRRPSAKTKSEDQPLPVIRKPVSISQSGPLTPPKPGDPVEPPPPLTESLRLADKKPRKAALVEPDFSDIGKFGREKTLDLDLSDADWPSSDVWVDTGVHSNYMDYEESSGGFVRVLGHTLSVLLIVGGTSSALYSASSVRDWADRTYAGVTQTILDSTQAGGATSPIATGSAANVQDEIAATIGDTTLQPAVDQPKTLYVRFTETLADLEFLMEQGAIDEAKTVLQTMDRVVYGYGAPEFKQIEEQIAAWPEGAVNQEALAENEQDANLLEAQQVADLARQRELETQAALEAERLAAQEAERQVALEAERVAAIEAERLEAERIAALEAERVAALEAERVAALEAERVAALEAERVAALEAERVAALEAEREAALEAEREAALEAEREAALEAEREAAAEAERLASIQADRLVAAEAERLAAERLAVLEAEREAVVQAQLQAAVVAARQAVLENQRSEPPEVTEEITSESLSLEEAQLRLDRIAQDRARQEQLEFARLERRRLEQLQVREQTPATGAQSEESIQAIAARQRAEARAQRIREASNPESSQAAARQREALEREAQIRLSQVPVPTAPLIPSEPVALVGPEPVEPASRGITDADLQTVYGQFAQLESAIESRDINAVLSLTESSGSRIQQVMQMFENNVTVEARLRNVSTLDSTGEIQGTLQITRLERVDGSVTGPPLGLSLVRLSSVRDGEGWSRIRW